MSIKVFSFEIKKYNSTLGTFVLQNCPVYANDSDAIYALDPTGGGTNIPVGSTYGRYDPLSNNTAGLLILERTATGPLEVTGATADPEFTSGAQFNLSASQPGTNQAQPTVTVTIEGTTSADFTAAVSAAGVPYVSAAVNSDGAIVFTHSQGGVIELTNTVGTPVTIAGFTVDTPLVTPAYNSSAMRLSNFTSEPLFTYTASDVAPDQNPADGRLWYYSAVDQIDVMIQNNGAWVGYQTVSNDVRGYNLTLCNAAGPIVAATAPTTQTDLAQSPLQYGDLWIDSSDLENYPMMYRWQQVSGQDQWVSIDTTDQVTQNGITFADARWAPNGDTDPVSDPKPTIVSLLTSSYLDLDAPDATLAPEGMLLWNTRRSGYNVKAFKVNYFNSVRFPDMQLPTVTSAWVSESGLMSNGAPYMGRKAQRNMVVKAMRSVVDTNTDIRDEDNFFNLMATPNYPELQPNMVVLNADRGETGYIVGDTPMRLQEQATAIQNWATNAAGATSTGEEGLVTRNTYLGLFYPSGIASDLSGNEVAVPSSHMMLRTILRNDQLAYPWFAPAGTRRGIIDNALNIGYLDSTTGEFITTKTRIGIRDTLYVNFINPMVFFTGQGLLNYGNKTSYDSQSALDRVNVARLIAYMRRQLTLAARPFVFEPNDAVTRAQIQGVVQTLMVDLVAKRGIYDYLVVCDESNNTPARIDRNELWVDVAIEPVKAAEFIYIPVRILNTGALAAA